MNKKEKWAGGLNKNETRGHPNGQITSKKGITSNL